MSTTKPPHKLHFAILAVDVVLFTIIDNELKVLLIKVHIPPYFIDRQGLPGGLIHPQEEATKAAERHLKDKGGINNTYLEQLYTFSAVNRDPRGRVVSVAYLGLIPAKKAQVNKEEVEWVAIHRRAELAYDHDEIIRTAVARLRAKIEYTNIIANLLPREFTLSELQNVYEVILGKKLDKRNFRKKILSLNLIKDTGRKKREGAHRPAQLYQFFSREQTVVEIL